MNDNSTPTRPPSPPSTTGIQDGDGICAALREAANQGRVVVMALVDGTRLNGVPLGFSPRGCAFTGASPAARGRHDPDGGPHGQCAGGARQCAGGGMTVLIREAAGQPPFIVRLAHVVYLRALTVAPRQTAL